MKEFSYTIYGGLGDFILTFLGNPGNRLISLSKIIPEDKIEFRAARNPAGIELLAGSQYFERFEFFQEDPNFRIKMPNDIEKIANIKEFPKLIPSIYLNEQEEEILFDIKRPYAVFHPFASCQSRYLSVVFNIKKLAQWIADVSGLNLIVLGKEQFNYNSENVKQIQGSTRLSVRIIQNSNFFVGTHSSMQCAAWVYDIPSLCVGPSQLLFHEWYGPNTYETHLKSLFKRKNIFMLFDECKYFGYFFDYFLRQNTSLIPRKSPAIFERMISLSGRA